MPPRRRSATSDDAAFAEQIDYLLARSAFYQGIERVGLPDIARLPLTTKEQIRATVSEAHPFGTHLCCHPQDIVRIHSTSGTTGTPSYIPLTAQDLDNWITGSARSYAASGLTRGMRVITTYNAGPFAAGAALASFDRLGTCHIPMATGNTERVLIAIERLRPDAIVATPSYAAYLGERGVATSSISKVLVAGEPGGGEPSFRAALELAWGARVTEAMGIGDIGVSLWGECEHQDGMHLGAHGFVHPELIDPVTERAIPIEHEAEGELVLTHLRHRAAPLLRFRTRDHVQVKTSPCPCGRPGPRIRCLGRTDDMLIVRGVNVFPSAIREVVSQCAGVTGRILIRAGAPLRVVVELAEGGTADARAIQRRLRELLVVTTAVELVPFGTLPRSEYKSRLVEHEEEG